MTDNTNTLKDFDEKDIFNLHFHQHLSSFLNVQKILDLYFLIIAVLITNNLLLHGSYEDIEVQVLNSVWADSTRHTYTHMQTHTCH